jgi:hypothetical protein
VEITLIAWMWLSLGTVSIIFFRYIRKEAFSLLDLVVFIPLGGFSTIFCTILLILQFRDKKIIDFKR